MNGKRLLAAVLLLLLAFTLSGCYSQNEIEETAFVLLWGLERGQNREYKITLQVAAPSKAGGSGGKGGGGGGGGSEEEPYWLTSVEADTIYGGIQELTKRASRVFHFSHAEALVIHEDVARQGIGAIVDSVTRNPDMRPDMAILITSDKIEDLFKVTYALENLPSTYIRRMLYQSDSHQEAPLYESQHFYTRMQAGDEAVMPKIKIWQKPENQAGEGGGINGGSAAVPTAAQGGSDSGGGGPKEKEPPKELILEGAAAFKGQKMVDWLTGPEVRSLTILRGDAKRCPLEVEVEGTKCSLQVREIYRHVKVKPNLASLGSSTIQVKIDMEADLFEVTSSGLVINNPRLDQVSRAASEKVNNQLKELIRKSKYELKSDILGFGELIRRNIPYARWEKEKEKWNDDFRNLIVKTDVEVIIRRIGMTTRSSYVY